MDASQSRRVESSSYVHELRRDDKTAGTTALTNDNLIKSAVRENVNKKQLNCGADL